jgi:DNA-binding transcriptional ArsR family regulator
MGAHSNGTGGPNRTLGQTRIPKARAEDCIKAMSAPQRRRILRTLHKAGEARSPNELAEAFKISVGHVSYHVKILRECRMVALTDTQPQRGAVEHFYASTVRDNDLIAKCLKATRSDDEKAARKTVR